MKYKMNQKQNQRITRISEATLVVGRTSPRRFTWLVLSICVALNPLDTTGFRVDPQYETPKSLKIFGQEHGADFSNWYFLAGYSFDWIKQFAQDTLKTTVAQAPNSRIFSHPVNWYVVNQSGVIETFHTSHTKSSTLRKTPKDQKSTGENSRQQPASRSAAIYVSLISSIPRGRENRVDAR